MLCLAQGAGFHQTYGIAYGAFVVLVVGVIFLGLGDELAVDGVLLLILYGDGDCLVALVAGDYADALFAEVTFFFHFLIC